MPTRTPVITILLLALQASCETKDRDPDPTKDTDAGAQRDARAAADVSPDDPDACTGNAENADECPCQIPDDGEPCTLDAAVRCVYPWLLCTCIAEAHVRMQHSLLVMLISRYRSSRRIEPLRSRR